MFVGRRKGPRSSRKFYVKLGASRRPFEWPCSWETTWRRGFRFNRYSGGRKIHVLLLYCMFSCFSQRKGEGKFQCHSFCKRVRVSERVRIANVLVRLCIFLLQEVNAHFIFTSKSEVWIPNTLGWPGALSKQNRKLQIYTVYIWSQCYDPRLLTCCWVRYSPWSKSVSVGLHVRSQSAYGIIDSLVLRPHKT